MELNFTPYRTSKNYGINSIVVDDKIIENCIADFENVSIKNANGIQISEKCDVNHSQIVGERLQWQRENNANCLLCIDIDRNLEEPVLVTFDFDKKNDKLVDVLNINVSKDVKAKVVVRYIGESRCYHNCLLKTNLEEKSQLDIAVLSDLSDNGNSFLSFDNCLEVGSKENFAIIDFACNNSIQNFYTKLNGDECESNLKSLYLAGNKNLVDLLYCQDIYGKNCVATIDTIGTLSDCARKNFKGTISFEKGCKKSYGDENEFCLLLSDTTKAKALPMLLCAEEDVDGKHSTSVGRVDEKQLFYIMSRGLSYQEALKLIVKAKFNQIVSGLFDKDLIDEINEKIDRKLYEKYC